MTVDVYENCPIYENEYYIPISYDESPLSPILKPARVGEQGSKQ